MQKYTVAWNILNWYKIFSVGDCNHGGQSPEKYKSLLKQLINSRKYWQEIKVMLSEGKGFGVKHPSEIQKYWNTVLVFNWQHSSSLLGVAGLCVTRNTVIIGGLRLSQWLREIKHCNRKNFIYSCTSMCIRPSWAFIVFTSAPHCHDSLSTSLSAHPSSLQREQYIARAGWILTSDKRSCCVFQGFKANQCLDVSFEFIIASASLHNRQVAGSRCELPPCRVQSSIDAHTWHPQMSYIIMTHMCHSHHTGMRCGSGMSWITRNFEIALGAPIRALQVFLRNPWHLHIMPRIIWRCGKLKVWQIMHISIFCHRKNCKFPLPHSPAFSVSASPEVCCTAVS